MNADKFASTCKLCARPGERERVRERERERLKVLDIMRFVCVERV